MFFPIHSGTRVIVTAFLALVAASSATVIGCSSDDSSTTTSDSGVKDTSITTDTGGGPVADTGGGVESGSDAGSLYTRLGGHDGIQKAIAAIIGEEVKDPDIASFFAPNLKNPNHKPNVADIEECLGLLLGQAAGGPEAYPATTTSGYVCRSMNDAHADLHIGNGTFDTFVAIAAAELKALKVADSDIAMIGAVLNGTKSQIVDPGAPDGGPFLGDGAAADAGGGG